MPEDLPADGVGSFILVEALPLQALCARSCGPKGTRRGFLRSSGTKKGINGWPFFPAIANSLVKGFAISRSGLKKESKELKSADQRRILVR